MIANCLEVPKVSTCSLVWLMLMMLKYAYTCIHVYVIMYIHVLTLHLTYMYMYTIWSRHMLLHLKIHSLLSLLPTILAAFS